MLSNWVMEKTLDSPLDCKEIKPVNPKGNQSWILLEGLMMKMKLQYAGHLMWRAESLKMILRARGEGGDRRWDGWMASPTQWTWVWVNSRSWWWIRRPGVLQSMGSQRWTRLDDWTELSSYCTQAAMDPTLFYKQFRPLSSWMSKIHFLQLPAWLALLTCIMCLFKEKSRVV